MEFIFSENTKELKPSAIREIFKSLTDPSVISFAAGNPSPQSFPVSYFRRFTDEVLDNNADAALQYGITEGFTPLCEDVLARNKRVFGIGEELFKLRTLLPAAIALSPAVSRVLT